MLQSKKQVLFTLATISLLFLLLNSATIYAYYFKSLSNLFLSISGILSIIAIMIKGRISFNKPVVLYFVLLFLGFTINGLISGFSVSIINYALKFIIAYLIVDVCFSLDDCFLKVFFVVSSILVFWALLLYAITFFKIDLSFFPVTDIYVTWWGQKKPLYAYFFMRLYQDMTIGGNVVYKLSHPLYEAGIAEIFTNYCVFYLLYFGRKRRLRIIGIIFFVISSFLTFSLIGIITFFLMIALYFVRTKRVISVSLFVIIAVFVGSFFVIQKLGTSSYSERTSDYLYVFQTIKNNFPLGIGLGNVENIQDNNSFFNSQNTTGFFSGLLSPVAYIGIFSVVYYFGLIKCFVNMIKENGILCRLSFAVLVVLALLTQPIAFISVMNVIIINGLYSNRNAKIINA